jgi:hypothetical protein
MLRVQKSVVHKLPYRARQTNKEEALQRRVSNPIRSVGLEEAVYLNDETVSLKDRRDIESLLEKFQGIEAEAQAESDAGVLERIGSIEMRYPHRSPSFLRRQEINQLLAKYPRPRPLTGPPGSLKERRTEYDYQTRKAKIAYGLLALYEKGQIDRLRKCESCGKWYFARPNQQRCSARCRHKKYQDTNQFKTYRKWYAKEQYWTAIARDLGAKIKDLSRSRVDRDAKTQLEARRKTALENADAARRERERERLKGGAVK